LSPQALYWKIMKFFSLANAPVVVHARKKTKAGWREHTLFRRYQVVSLHMPSGRKKLNQEVPR